MAADKKNRALCAAVCCFMAVVLMFFPTVSGFRANAQSDGRAILEDLDNCLTQAEEEALTKEMLTVAQKVGINIGIVITAELLDNNGRHVSDDKYIEDFCKANFGSKSDSISLLLFNSHDKPEYDYCEDDMYMIGKADELYYKRADKIWDNIYAALDNHNVKSDLPSEPNVYKNYSSANYYMACMNFCKILDKYGDPGSAFWVGLGDFVRENIGAVFFGCIVGVVVALIFANSIKKSYMKKAPISAAQYLDKHRTDITYRNDAFIREYTTSYRTSSSSGGGRSGGGGGGGGGGHHSSGHHR